MSQITRDTFALAVAKYFEPIAKEQGWKLFQRNPDLYEIATPYFAMRIRFDVGAHAKSINATLIPTDQMPDEVARGCRELGVAVVAGYNGMPIEYIPRESTQEGFFEQAKYVSNMAKQFGLPYLLGQKSDWNSVTKYIEEQIKERAEEIKKIKFPPNVQKRWHLPPEFPKEKE